MPGILSFLSSPRDSPAHWWWMQPWLLEHPLFTDAAGNIPFLSNFFICRSLVSHIFSFPQLHLLWILPIPWEGHHRKEGEGDGCWASTLGSSGKLSFLSNLTLIPCSCSVGRPHHRKQNDWDLWMLDVFYKTLPQCLSVLFSAAGSLFTWMPWPVNLLVQFRGQKRNRNHVRDGPYRRL